MGRSHMNGGDEGSLGFPFPAHSCSPSSQPTLVRAECLDNWHGMGERGENNSPGEMYKEYIQDFISLALAY
jgi:hypothetical protein